MVIDTLIAVLDNAGISPAIGPVGLCIRLMQEIGSRYGATIIWLHHTTKNGSLTTGNDTTRVTNSTTTWSCWTKPTPRDVPIAMLSTAKHRGKERRTVHEDLGKVHEDGLLKEL